MSSLTDIREKVKSFVRDDSGKLVYPDDYDRNINAACNRYSKHRPDIKTIDVTGNGTHDYTLPAGWIDGFSTVQSIEYPKGEVPEEYLDNEEYKVYQVPGGVDGQGNPVADVKKIRLINYSPSNTESFRVAFTIPRTVTTVPANDVDAFCTLAAALCLEELANLFTQTSDSTVAADSVNYRTKSDEFTRRAKRLLQLYKEHLGLKEDDITPPASAVTDMQINYPGGGDRLTHSKYGRRRR